MLSPVDSVTGRENVKQVARHPWRLTSTLAANATPRMANRRG